MISMKLRGNWIFLYNVSKKVIICFMMENKQEVASMRKKYVIRILALLSVISLFFNLMLPKANAEVMTHEKYEMNWSRSKSLNKLIQTELIKTANGKIAYCLTYGLKSPNGEDLPEMSKTNDIVYRVLLNGYPQKVLLN